MIADGIEDGMAQASAFKAEETGECDDAASRLGVENWPGK